MNIKAITAGLGTRTDFRFYLSALFCGFSGLLTHGFLVGWLTFAITGSNKAVASIILVTGLTNILVAPLLGILIDRTKSLNRLMQACFVGLAILMVSIGLLIQAGLELKHLLIATVFKAIVVSVYDSARQAMLHEVSDEKHITSATALVRSSSNLAQICMPILAGWAIALFHAHKTDITPAEYVYYVIAGVFLAAFVLMRAVPSNNNLQSISKNESSASVMEGFRYALSTPSVRDLMLVNWLLLSFSILLVALLPGYAVDVLDIGPGHYGTLFALYGTGALLGSLFAATLSAKRRGRMVLISAAVTAAAFLVLGAQASYVLALILALTMGVGEGIRVSLTSALMQSYVSHAFMGRIFGIEALETALVQVAVFWIGHGADLHGSGSAILGCGAALLVCIVGIYALLPGFRNLE